MNIKSQFERQIVERFETFEPHVLSLPKPRAGVLVPIVMDPVPSILLTVRAAHLKSHPGQVSFPGGMAEPEDDSINATALRESLEEIALAPSRVKIAGQLSTTLSKDGVQVYPIVGFIENDHDLIASPDEISEIFTVPWTFFASTAPEFREMQRDGHAISIPHYYYEGRHIWGLTAMILLELINVIEKTQWPLPAFNQGDLTDD